MDLRPRHALVALAFALPLAAFALLIEAPSTDLTVGSGTSHFYIVSIVAGLALVLAVSVIVAARRVPDSRTFFLAMGFVAMATIFFAHGLGTSPIFATHATAIDDYGSAAAAPAVPPPTMEELVFLLEPLVSRFRLTDGDGAQRRALLAEMQMLPQDAAVLQVTALLKQSLH